MNIKYILSVAVLALGLVSCSNEAVETDGGKNVPLQITANIESTRAAGIEDREFNNGEWIGFFVGDMKEAWNARAVYDGKWIIDHSDIMLDGKECPVYAYYPYDEFGTMENYLGFRFSAGVNTLVSDGTTYVNNLKPEANLNFKHVMARVSIVVNNPDKLELNNITLSGESIYSSAFYSFTSENKIRHENVDPVIVNNTNADKTAVMQTIDALLIPTETAVGETNLTLNFADGKKYNTTVSLPVLKMGGYYSLPINLNGKSEENPTHEGHEYVDLGLPSGTLWATCNIGAEKAEDYGVSFAWGETKPKTNFYISTYKWCKGTHESMTKYCIDSSYGTVDKKTVLDAEDDAAHVNWGGKWRIPTESEAKELLANCSWVWTTMNDINGYKITGASGKWIFIPAAGWWPGAEKEKEGVQGIYWLNSLSTSSTMPSYLAQYLTITSTSHFIADNGRNCGLSVRPVFSK